MQSKLQWAVYLFVGICLTTEAKRSKEAEGTHQAARASQAERFTVKITNTTADLFTPEIQSGHGSGFIVALSADRGLIFTNNHVVDRDPLEAQQIEIAFAAPKGMPETIPGKVVYRSPSIDFAVLEFDPSELKRVRSWIQTANLENPTRGGQWSKKGTQVMAFGHPLDSENISTFGVISGLRWSPADGVFLQTSAPINPGNSGGPLLEMESGQVIGMNTAKVVGADNVGFAIPIDRILSDFAAWTENPTTVHRKALLVRLDLFDANALVLEKLDALIQAQVPNFFDEHAGLLVVTEAHPQTGLKTGDLILRVNGEVVGTALHRLADIVRFAKQSVRLTVIRQRKLVEVDAPVISLALPSLRQQLDFVLVSGLLLSEQLPDREWGIADGASRVIVRRMLPLSPAAEVGGPEPGSVVVELQVHGKSYPIRRLADVRRALAERPEDEPIRIIYHAPIIFQVGEQKFTALIDHQFGGPRVLKERQMRLLPIDQVVTPKELSLRQMRANFDFSGRHPKTRDWRYWVGKKGCADRLQEAE